MLVKVFHSCNRLQCFVAKAILQQTSVSSLNGVNMLSSCNRLSHLGWSYYVSNMASAHMDAYWSSSTCKYGTCTVMQHRRYSLSSADKPPPNKDNPVNEVIQHLAEHALNITTDEGNMREIVSFLIKKKFQPKEIKSLLLAQTELLQQSADSWKKAFRALKDLGFHSDQLLSAAVKIPGVFENKLQKLILTIDTLRAIGFRERQITNMILLYPGLLGLSPKQLINQYSRLLKLFTKYAVVHMLLGNPALFSMPFSQIKMKRDYVHDVMRIDVKDMTDSKFLRYDLVHIYARHQFLYRAGLYSTPDKQGNVKFPNPTLKEIMDTSDAYFARKVAALPEEEYQAFVEICKIEVEYGRNVESIDEYYDDESLSDLEEDPDAEEEDAYVK